MGIDPGSRVTGFAVIKTIEHETQHLSHGIIDLKHGEHLSGRLLILAKSLQTLLTRYQPDLVVVEKIFLGKNADSAFKLGHARGVVLTEVERAGAVLHEYATRVIKKGITGKGSADKLEVCQTLVRLLGLKKIEQLDASDALALAVFQAQQIWVDSRRAKMKEVSL